MKYLRILTVMILVLFPGLMHAAENDGWLRVRYGNDRFYCKAGFRYEFSVPKELVKEFEETAYILKKKDKGIDLWLGGTVEWINGVYLRKCSKKTKRCIFYEIDVIWPGDDYIKKIGSKEVKDPADYVQYEAGHESPALVPKALKEGFVEVSGVDKAYEVIRRYGDAPTEFYRYKGYYVQPSFFTSRGFMHEVYFAIKGADYGVVLRGQEYDKSGKEVPYENWEFKDTIERIVKSISIPKQTDKAKKTECPKKAKW